METTHLAALLVATAGLACDLRTRRIPNVLTLPAAALGIAAGAWADGTAGAAASALGCAVGLALFFPFFALRGMGGGDVKLLAALGAWLGPGAILSVAVWSAMCGGALALAVMLYRGLGAQVLRNLASLFRFWRTAGLIPLPALTLERATGPRLAYALPITAGLVVTLWAR